MIVVDDADVTHQATDHAHPATARLDTGTDLPVSGIAYDDLDLALLQRRLDDERLLDGLDRVLDGVRAGFRAGENDLLNVVVVDAARQQPAAQVVADERDCRTDPCESQTKGIAGIAERLPVEQA